MTWRVLAALLPAACAMSLLIHWINQRATRIINRHVTAALADDNWARWEGELERPYNWQDDGL